MKREEIEWDLDEVYIEQVCESQTWNEGMRSALGDSLILRCN